MKVVKGTLGHVVKELHAASRSAADVRSFFRLAADVFLYRLLKTRALGAQNRERTVRLRGGGRRQLSWPVDDNYLGRLRA